MAFLWWPDKTTNERFSEGNGRKLRHTAIVRDEGSTRLRHFAGGDHPQNVSDEGFERNSQAHMAPPSGKV